MNLSDGIFREYDIRGTWGADLTADVAGLIGRAYGALAARHGAKIGPGFKVTVGRDVRTSSKALRDALVAALTESGIDVIDVGECPTPLQYFSIHTLPVGGGIMITGSHNPPEYNGFKVSVGKETIHGAEIQELKDIIKKDVLNKPVKKAEKPGKVEYFDIVSSYIDYVSKAVKLPALKRPLKVVLDSGNGTAGPVAVPLIKKLGCEVVDIFSEPDGRFPNHHPDPTVPANLKHLIEVVKKEKADFGVAFDGDADRIGVVDELGNIIWGDKLMIIFAKSILKERPGATLVGEVKCSQVMYDEIAKLGGVPVMWKTGHSLIKARMKELKAAMAGEMSGHIFFADKWFGFDDAVYSACRVLEIVAGERVKDASFAFSSMLAGIAETVVTPEIRIDCPDDLKFELIKKLDTAIGAGGDGFKVRDIIRIDGLRVNFEGGWALVRASNTQPVLVLRFEANDQATLDRAKGFIKGKLESVRPEVAVNF
jgi:phosphomannomutase/phosphoglucomutase